MAMAARKCASRRKGVHAATRRQPAIARSKRSGRSTSGSSFPA
jgi:hypothetical protein